MSFRSYLNLHDITSWIIHFTIYQQKLIIYLRNTEELKGARPCDKHSWKSMGRGSSGPDGIPIPPGL